MNTYHSLEAIQHDLQVGTISCLSLTESYIKRIHDQDHLNAFLEVYEDEALDAAQEVDAKLKAGNAGRLAGMVIGIKDNICYKGHKLSAASKILEGFESLFSATVVERLLEEDVIIIGRLNCDEFAMGSTNENSAYGPVLNPVNASFVPGGSSGGSAAAVAADLCLASLGSDTGGSIRQPASFCGVMGYKPTYGRISRWGLIAYASSFDQIGPFTHNAQDAALLMEIMSGSDEYDSTCSEQAVPPFSELLENNEPSTVGYMKETLESSALCPEIKAHILEQIEGLKAQGHKVVEIDFPYLNYVVPTYYVLTTAEASSNLARFDGVHFGHRSSDSQDIPSTYANSRTEGFGEEVQRRIMLGTFVLSAGYYDAYYTKAQKVRRLLHEKTLEIFQTCDFILSPTSPHTAIKIGQTYDDPTQLYLEDIYTVHANIVGIPAVSLPTGTHSNGLPFGIQLMAPAFKDAELLAFSNSIMNSK
jgi:aspartyl-tRNA(Asn)/glutamyl-tRNA(Gln) amidotransferase subunit A